MTTCSTCTCPGLPETVAALLTQASGGYELSEKGLVAMALAESADITVLLEPGIAEAISQLTTPRSKSMERDLSAIRGDGIADDMVRDLAVRWGGRRERRSRPAGKLSLGKGTKAPRVLERLCEVGWAERGLMISCEACRIPSFIPLAATSNAAICPGCQKPGRYDTDAALTVYYRLNSYLDLASDQGILPHLLVAAALTRKYP